LEVGRLVALSKTMGLGLVLKDCEYNDLNRSGSILNFEEKSLYLHNEGLSKTPKIRSTEAGVERSYNKVDATGVFDIFKRDFKLVSDLDVSCTKYKTFLRNDVSGLKLNRGKNLTYNVGE
jgi:hypothetical protein